MTFLALWVHQEAARMLPEATLMCVGRMTQGILKSDFLARPMQAASYYNLCKKTSALSMDCTLSNLLSGALASVKET